MRRLVLEGPGRLSIEEVEPEALQAGEVRVEVQACGICGSDIHGYAGANNRRPPGTVMGHEMAGVVVSSGGDLEEGTAVAVNPVLSCGACDRCLVGRRNLCEERRIVGCLPEVPGGFADQVVVPEDNAVPLAGAAPLEWGCLVEPFSVGAHAARLAGDAVVGEVAVVGGGPIGVGAALAARRAGAKHVLVSEPLEERRRVAGALGLEAVSPGDPRLGDGAFSLVLECVGLEATIADALRVAVAGGTIVLTGLAQPSLPVPAADLVMGERRILGSAVYEPEDFAATAAWVSGGELDLSPLIEARTAIGGLPDAFEEYERGTRTAFKTIMVPDQL